MPDLTDLEITRLCAEAADREVVIQLGDWRFPNTAYEDSLWNPLRDRAQAMELVEKLHLHIIPHYDDNYDFIGWSVWRETANAKDTNILRAICLCAARVQLSKKEKHMGMFDYVNVAMPCPKCGSELDGFQSKDSACDMGTIEPSAVSRFYTTCRQCEAWIEFRRHPVTSPPPRSTPYTRQEIESMGFKLGAPK